MKVFPKENQIKGKIFINMMVFKSLNVIHQFNNDQLELEPTLGKELS